MADVRDLAAVVLGASSGLGAAIASELARRGARVTAVARRAALLEGVVATLPGDGHRAVACDLTDAPAARAMLAEAEAVHGSVDVLIHAAGIEERRATLDADLDHYRRILETNLLTAVTATLAVLPGMHARGRGYLAYLSSDQGRAPTPMTGAYGASKAALSAFVDTVAHECHGSGVHAHTVYPGWVDTPLGRSAVEDGMPLPPRAVRRRPEQVARATVDGLGGRRIDINVAPLAALAPVMRPFAPRFYARQIRRASG